VATNTKVDVVIMCGGEGTRLKEITQGVIPKCVVPINGKPFLHYLFEQLHKSNVVNKLVLAASNKADEIYDSIGLTDLFTIDWAIDIEPHGTLVDLLNTLKFITTKTALVMNGDTYCKDFDFSKFLDYHNGVTNDLTVAKYNDKDTGIWLINTTTINKLFLHLMYFLQQEDRVMLPREAALSWPHNKVDYYRIYTPFIDIGTVEGYREFEKEVS
jgi:NDP-sugar pyrophosphorylase family protein